MKIQSSIEKLQLYASLFRLGRPLEATEDLIESLEEIIPQIMSKKDIDLASTSIIFSGLLACQESEDWLGLADYIEYELIDLLESSFVN